MARFNQKDIIELQEARYQAEDPSVIGWIERILTLARDRRDFDIPPFRDSGPAAPRGAEPSEPIPEWCGVWASKFEDWQRPIESGSSRGGICYLSPGTHYQQVGEERWVVDVVKAEGEWKGLWGCRDHGMTLQRYWDSIRKDQKGSKR
jgi:hypothetical protein